MGAPTKSESVSKKTDKVEVTATGKAADTKLDSHHSYEFGGPWGVTAMIVFFPMLMYYLWICCTFYDGQVELPASIADIQPFFYRMLSHIREDASPSPWAIKVYSTYFFFQLFIAWVIPGFKQEGLPVPSLGYQTLMYNCNAYQCFYLSIAVAGDLHFADIFHLASIIEHFGELMTVAIIYGFGVSIIMYFWTVLRNEQIRMSGNFMYDFWMGACLNPRLGSVDLKLWAEVRIPWMILFFISLAGASKQFDDYGYVSANMWFKVLATFLFANACGKSEECIPQTWDIFYEKWGFMIIFWNFAGVPFTYCYSDVYMATHDPAKYQFSTIGYIALYGTLLTSYYIFDTAMAQKSNFKMQMQGVFRKRMTFPQLPGNVVENPRYIQTAHGNKLLVDGWWRVVRKPNYTADWFQVLSWALVVWTASPIPYFYPLFFTAMLLHRTGRDFERCAIKYGKDWEEYCRIVPYRFVPYVY